MLQAIDLWPKWTTIIITIECQAKPLISIFRTWQLDQARIGSCAIVHLVYYYCYEISMLILHTSIHAGSSPQAYTGLTSGQHRVKVVPSIAECGRNRRPKVIMFTVWEYQALSFANDTSVICFESSQSYRYTTDWKFNNRLNNDDNTLLWLILDFCSKNSSLNQPTKRVVYHAYISALCILNIITKPSALNFEVNSWSLFTHQSKLTRWKLATLLLLLIMSHSDINYLQIYGLKNYSWLHNSKLANNHYKVVAQEDVQLHVLVHAWTPLHLPAPSVYELPMPFCGEHSRCYHFQY